MFAFLTSSALVAPLACQPNPQTQSTAQTAVAPETKPAEALADPCPVAGDNLRGKAFYEILFMKREAKGSGTGNYFNSLGNSFDVSNEVIDARFLALDAEKLRKEFGSDGVRFNGPRRFVANSFTAMAFDGGKKRIIDAIPFYLYGTFKTPDFEAFMTGKKTPYKVLISKRTNTFSFSTGERVHELVTPEGAVYTMFSLSLRVDPKNTIENLPTLGKRLSLPKGWAYRERTLEKNLVLSSAYDTDPPNTIVLDQFENNYQHNPGK